MMSYTKNIKGSHQAILYFVSEIGSYCIKAGILESNNPVGESGTRVAEYALDNEFGTNKIPARPFIGTATEEQGDGWVNTVKKKVPLVLKQKMKLSALLETVGKKMKFAIKDQIKFITIPKNAPATIKQKGFDNPLIDTGLMIETVDYEVVKK
jgi:hypothetical protein